MGKSTSRPSVIKTGQQAPAQQPAVKDDNTFDALAEDNNSSLGAGDEQPDTNAQDFQKPGEV